MAKRKPKKRPATFKTIGGVKVQTNPKFWSDVNEQLDTSILQEMLSVTGMNATMYSLTNQIFRAGIAIGRARATASGKKRKR